ncbi:MAG TPA: helix-turn-helix domain-containing protein [Acidimicrobiales bacterium]|nr:helix-turn-helix domain-containing protein [Acidimicrobiales bacterium]
MSNLGSGGAADPGELPEEPATPATDLAGETGHQAHEGQPGNREGLTASGDPEQADAMSSTEGTTSPGDIKELTDPRELRAVTHPVRLALLEALRLHEQLTATEAGELIGESPTTCSFHLRQLAKYGFVDEAERGAGRRRPWRLAHQGIRFATSDSDNTDLTVAATALENLLVRIWFDRFEAWERVRHTYSEEWRRASDIRESLIYVTPDELAELAEAQSALVARYNARTYDPSTRPEGAEPVELVSFAFPLQSRAK